MTRAELQLGWKSIPGYRHQIEGRENEDTLFVAEEHPYFDAVLLVADGMGGFPEPKLASETATEAARAFLFDPARWQRLLSQDGRGVPTLLRAAVQDANEAVLALARASGERKAPGTTLSAAVFADGRLHVAHAGDGSALLMRAGRLHPLTGGESRREGNRPQSFLGRAARVEVEEVALALQPGDRILLCTDGLTRYFGAVTEPTAVGAGRGDGGRGAGALHEVLGREGADPPAIASQLTAHGRGDQYDDDTTVVVAEVVALRDAPEPIVPPTTRDERPPGHEIAPPRLSNLGWGPVVALLLLALAVGWGGGTWWSGRGGDPESQRRTVGTAPAPPSALTAGPVRGLPSEPLILFDRAGRHLFTLQSGARPRPAPAGSLALQGARLLADGQLSMAGEWRLEADRGRLIDAKGRSFFVDVEPAAGVIRARHPGVLSVQSAPPGARVELDGERLGETPLKRTVAAGSHRMRLRWRDGRTREQAIEVPARGKIELELSP